MDNIYNRANKEDQRMFIAQALADFSSQTMKHQQQQQYEENERKQDGNKQQAQKQNDQKNKQEADFERKEVEQNQQEQRSVKRPRDKQQEQQLNKLAENQQQEEGQDKGDQNSQITYTCFSAGDKILVKETYENGWWLGHPLKKPELLGYFPSNYVQVGVQPPPPPPPSQQKNSKQKDNEEHVAYDPEEGVDWMRKQMDKIPTGPVSSEQYHGIKGYKMVKIDDKNQNVLKGNHVKYDVATGLAKVPIKDQAPTAKAVRQMGYYFDYHQWNESKNSGPQVKARPDIRKKKQKKLNLKLMNREYD